MWFCSRQRCAPSLGRRTHANKCWTQAGPVSMIPQRLPPKIRTHHKNLTFTAWKPLQAAQLALREVVAPSRSSPLQPVRIARLPQPGIEQLQVDGPCLLHAPVQAWRLGHVEGMWHVQVQPGHCLLQPPAAAGGEQPHERRQADGRGQEPPATAPRACRTVAQLLERSQLRSASNQGFWYSTPAANQNRAAGGRRRLTIGLPTARSPHCASAAASQARRCSRRSSNRCGPPKALPLRVPESIAAAGAQKRAMRSADVLSVTVPGGGALIQMWPMWRACEPLRPGVA